ncbi:MAG: ATP-dependent DNA helicase RecG [Phycisphaerales bacterium]|nr:ATP-dependent DNA helicase RecG [Phycisphaerales bacterium]
MGLRADDNLQYTRGVGPARAALFEKLGLTTVGELLEYYPFRYETEIGDVEIAELTPGVIATVRGEVIDTRRHHPHFWADIADGSGVCRLRWFNKQHAGRGIRPGVTVVATGEVSFFDGKPGIVHPSVQTFETDAELRAPVAGKRQVGVYSETAGLTSVAIRRVIQNILAHPQLPITEFLPESLRTARDLPPREAAIRTMHTPEDDQQLAQARRRLAYEEFLMLEVSLALRRRRTVQLDAASRITVTPEIDQRIRARFPFDLTASQNRVIREICADLGSGHAMTRLLQGDVGSGKTVIALYCCLAAIAAGAQAAIMAPTEILAEQHFANVERYLAGSRVRRRLLTSAQLRPRREKTLAEVERGDVDLVIGTQALVYDDVAFRDLAMVVIDEQHKFGVVQRARFRTKGLKPHLLVMTATPIPRTLAMTVFGDLDVSTIDASPPGRGSITTKVVPAREWETVMKYVRTRLEAGEQAYVVCPTIGELEDEENPAAPPPQKKRGLRPRGPDLISTLEEHARLTAGPWAGLPVGVLHGSMRPEEKRAAIGEFAAGRLKALVSTTVIEVGVDVANATIMIVQHAERFGLAQLHQLRGRVGRGAKDSLCVLLAHGSAAKAATPRGPAVSQRPSAAGRPAAPSAGSASKGKAVDRLSVLAETTNGFRIAEADLRIRGPGELLGTRQSGLPALRVGDLVADFELLETARNDAFELIRHDPTLSQPDHLALRDALRRQFREKLDLIDAG